MNFRIYILILTPRSRVFKEEIVLLNDLQNDFKEIFIIHKNSVLTSSMNSVLYGAKINLKGGGIAKNPGLSHK